ncbi:styrene monooxygenase/indole monooxygenase family protein [Cohnella candidum]|uniref:Styrene monooxygenase n=1 Tax=Cohnella candidum TaxID=2674991 RepID=A0A3G3JZQ2_9BACL|nr:styrene monooxygenase/indole monooxygenase family protein [Cohnella candidum]AYQ73351.1 styrene monooxygenase [Cohnella candidum]
MSRKKIAVIGAGMAGSTLAYALANDGFCDVQVFVSKDAEEIRKGRIPSTQVHFHPVLEREQRYGMPDYGEAYGIDAIELLMGGQKMFKGRAARQSVTLDQRIYLSALLEGLPGKGVQVRKARLSPNDLPRLAEEFDLIVDASGKIGPLGPFPVNRGISNAPSFPQRVCTAGLFHGIEPDEGHKMSYHILPGLGEMFELTTVTEHGPARSLLLEAVPGSELDRIKGDKGPITFIQEMKELLKAFFPSIYERVDEERFRLVDDQAYTRLAIQPRFHLPYTSVNGTLVLGCGDSVALNDPITGQGANLASFCAEALFDTLKEFADREWNVFLAERYWDRIREMVVKVSEWTNAMMGPPSDSFADLLVRASQSQETADELVNLFLNPIQAHEAFFGISRTELLRNI